MSIFKRRHDRWKAPINLWTVEGKMTLHSEWKWSYLFKHPYSGEPHGAWVWNYLIQTEEIQRAGVMKEEIMVDGQRLTSAKRGISFCLQNRGHPPHPLCCCSTILAKGQCIAGVILISLFVVHILRAHRGPRTLKHKNTGKSKFSAFRNFLTG